jgi:methionyl-tRNA formyltransferase
MKIIFMGTMAFAVPILEGLAKHHHVSQVITQPDRPAGRKQELKPSFVKLSAMRLGIPLLQPERIKDHTETILAKKPDLIVVAAYGQWIPKALLETPPFKAINVHASLLPAYRGGSPMQWALLNGDEKTGVTVMVMAPKMDSGPILSQQEIAIGPDDDVASLEAKLGCLGRDLLLETLPGWFAGGLTPIPQDPEKVSFAYNLGKEAEKLDFTLSAKRISDHVRAMRPAPVAYGLLDNIKLKIHRVAWEAADFPGAHRPGEIVRSTHQEVVVQTGRGVIRLMTVQIPGKTAQPITDFMNGNGMNILLPGKIFI